eukprot:2775-Heterococcus_DN1.PRE.2
MACVVLMISAWIALASSIFIRAYAELTTATSLMVVFVYLRACLLLLIYCYHDSGIALTVKQSYIHNQAWSLATAAVGARSVLVATTPDATVGITMWPTNLYSLKRRHHQPSVTMHRLELA